MAFDAGAIEATATLDKASFFTSLQEIRAEAAKGVQVPLKFDTSQAGLAAAAASAKAAIQAMMGKGVTIPLVFDTSRASIAQSLASARLVALAVSNGGIHIPLIFDTSPAGIAAAVASAKAAAQAAAGAGIVIPIRFAVVGGGPGGVPPPGSGGPGGGGAPPVIVPPGAGGKGGGGGGGGWWGWLGGTTALFGGAASINNLLLLTHLIVEFTAMVLPAIIAAGAFGIAASDAFSHVARQITNMHTVMDATGKSMFPFTNSLENLHKAVTPEVYQLYGDAIQIAGAKTGIFAAIATGTAHTVDQLGIRLTEALTQGKGMNQFLDHAVSGFGQWGDIIGNIAGAIGNLIKLMPGFAQFFLTLLKGGTGALEWVTGFAGDVGKVALAAHGLWLYGGLAVTALTLIGRSATTEGGKLNTWGLALAGIGRNIGAVVTNTIWATKNLGLAAGATSLWVNTLGRIPGWGWAIAGAVAIGGLVIALMHVKDATQQFIDLETQWINASPLDQAVQRLGLVQDTLAQKLQVSTQRENDLFKAQGNVNQVTGVASRYLSTYNATLDHAAVATQEIRNAQGQFSQDQVTFTQRVDTLSKSYGGQSQALALLRLAGVTTKQMIDGSKKSWLDIKTAVDSTYLGYKAMGIQSGVLGNDLRAVNAVTNDQFKAMQNLNGALDTYLQIVSSIGGNNASVIQAMRGVTTAAQAQGASFNGVNDASIALQSQFFNTFIPGVQKMGDSLRQAGVPTNKLAEYFATILAPAVHEGALQSQIARDSIFRLAQEAGYAGPNKIKPLRDWIDDYRTSLSKIPKAVFTTLHLNASGAFQIHTISLGGGPPQIVIPRNGAFGGLVTGGMPGRDSVPMLTMPGEVIVPTSMVQAGAVDHLRGHLPGFAAGGIVPGYSGGVGGLWPWANQDDQNQQMAMASQMEKNFLAANKAYQKKFAFTGGGGLGAGPGGPVEAVARAMFPWPASMWSAFNYVEMREAGYNLTAQNPSSGAYGVAQFINGPSEYFQWGGSPFTAQGQFTGMFNYIRSRYGTPLSAAAHEQAFNWYDQGGWLPPGVSIAINGTGRPEPVGWAQNRPAGSHQPLVGAVTFAYSNANDTSEAMHDLLFTLKHAQQRGFGGSAL